MKKRHLFFLAAIGTAIEFLFTGCAHQQSAPTLPPPASHTGVDQAVAAAKTSQQKAAQEVTVIEKAITDPVLKQQVVDLHSTISDLGFKLDDATAKISWYEGQYQQLYSDLATATANLATETAIAAEKSKEAHDNACQRDLFLYTMAAIFAVFCLQWAGKLVPATTGWIGIAARIAAFVGGFALAYGFLRGIVAFTAKVIP